MALNKTPADRYGDTPPWTQTAHDSVLDLQKLVGKTVLGQEAA